MAIKTCLPPKQRKPCVYKDSWGQAKLPNGPCLSEQQIQEFRATLKGSHVATMEQLHACFFIFEEKVNR